MTNHPVRHRRIVQASRDGMGWPHVAETWHYGRARPAPRWRSWLAAPLFFVIAFALVLCFLLVDPEALDPLERD